MGRRGGAANRVGQDVSFPGGGREGGCTLDKRTLPKSVWPRRLSGLPLSPAGLLNAPSGPGDVQDRQSRRLPPPKQGAARTLLGICYCLGGGPPPTASCLLFGINLACPFLSL